MSDPVKQVAMRILDLREISDYTVDKMAEEMCIGDRLPTTPSR